ncbi:L-2-hydroxyglutarate oxidase [Streptomyces phaeolivaceus]|uniref:L-2-hydroxyglutarate oxidase n=1 Tax=Streptomyces phaeolivaceus TaxID=2653200 RepID=A0A5P8KEF1_9ACTN|nr:L-2-hydroxyglutarate oxidase [Streptomyces phaeolivaceus]QFR01656.1 L-2-hydroxyglutarate oxidase [Streptomyces phaeolivaceus]
MYEVVVVGGGIVGAATAHELTSRGLGPVLVLDKEPFVARHQTGHNSGVIHSGIYYEPGSHKAVMCREGAAATKAFAAEHGIPVTECGKLLVATDRRELERLSALEERAKLNSIDAETLDAAELRRREPHVTGLGALFIRETAIVDYTEITAKLVHLVTEAGGEVRTGVTVTGVRETTDAVTLRTDRGGVTARRVVFCAGLQADRMARLCGLAPDVRIVPFRGEYYDIVPHRANLVSTLVYPVPDPDLPFLGVHLTPTLDGGLNVGPSAVLGLSREGYPKGSLDWRDVRDMASFPGMWRVARGNVRVGLREMRNSLWKRGYLKECRKYCPELTLEDLIPREAGIRAQAVMRDGSFVHDFLVRRTDRTLHVLNAPSPAATSALPIAAHVVSLLDGTLG